METNKEIIIKENMKLLVKLRSVKHSLKDIGEGQLRILFSLFFSVIKGKADILF